jgi:hypothetical protein
MLAKNIELPLGYEIRDLSSEEFVPLWKEHASRIFDDESQVFRVYESLTEEEQAKAKELQTNMGQPFQLRLGLYHEGNFAGWCCGDQENSETFYMRNSAILEGHRRKGLYTALLMRTIGILTEKGFQKIYSRHSATNNAVIIPKLKAGFTIASLEICDKFGVLVNLVYFPKELRRKMMIYRVGDSKPDEEIKGHLKL